MNNDSEIIEEGFAVNTNKKKKPTKKVSDIQILSQSMYQIGSPIVYMEKETDSTYPGKIKESTDRYIVADIPSYRSPDHRIDSVVTIECQIIDGMMCVRFPVDILTLGILISLDPVIHLVDSMNSDELYDLADYVWKITSKHELYNRNIDRCDKGTVCKNNRAGHLAYYTH
jgi:hypothetical protein